MTGLNPDGLGVSRTFNVTNTERGSIANVHTLGATEDFATKVVEFGGETVDLGGQTFTVSFLDDTIPAETEVRNGTLKLGDGENTDFVRVASGTANVTFRNVTFDFNGANNTGSPSNDGWVSFYGNAITLDQCRFTSANGRSANDMALYVDSASHYVAGCKVTLGGNENDVHMAGSQGRRIANEYTNCRDVNAKGPDTISVGMQSYGNATGLRLAPPGVLTDMQFIGVTIEDNTSYGVRVTAGIDDYENIVIRGKFQGNQGPGVELNIDKTAGSGNIVVAGTFKRNQFTQGGGAQVRIREADGAKIEIDQMTNINGTDANWGVFEDAAAQDTRVDYHHVDSADFATAIVSGSTRTRVNGVAQEALGGSAPATPANWAEGDIVEDTDNAGDAYIKLSSSGFSQIST